MGYCCLPSRGANANDDVLNGEGATTTNGDTLPQKIEKEPSLHFFDAVQYEHEHEEPLVAHLNGSVYFDPRYSTFANKRRGSLTCLGANDTHPTLEDDDSLLRKNQNLSKMAKMASITNLLTKPRVLVEQEGFPGNLSDQELAAVKLFRKRLQEHNDTAYQEMVYQFKEFEEEPFALCRSLRARGFDVDKVFEMMGENVDLYKEARGEDFYRDIDTALGAPLSAVLTQYPYLFSGTSKDGFPIVYSNVGQFNFEGFECVTSLDNVIKIQWNTLVYKFAEVMKAARVVNPGFVRIETLTILNLKGLTRAHVSSRTMDLLQKLSSVATCFPEMLYRLIIINAPSFFTLTWAVIRQFLDPNTAAKIEIFSNEKAGHRRLLELVDASQLARDCGGEAPTTGEQIMRQGSGLGGPRRRIVKLFTLQRKVETKYDFELEENEELLLNVYTTSRDPVEFTLLKDRTDPINKVKVSGNQDGSSLCTKIASGVKGQGSFCIVSLPEAALASTEHFLVIGDVFDTRDLERLDLEELEDDTNVEVKDKNVKNSRFQSLKKLLSVRAKREPVDIKKETMLMDALPLSTSAERQRFLVARNLDVEAAQRQLSSYLAWRESVGLSMSANDSTESQSDKDDWELSVRKALEIFSSKSEQEIPPATDKLPRLVRFPTIESSENKQQTAMLCTDSKRVLQIMAGQFDLNLAPEEVYGLAIALYLDKKFSRHSTEKITVMVDLRGGEGWANPKPKQLVSLVKVLASNLQDLYPERLHKCIVFPLPSPALWLWNIVKVFIDKETAEKVHIVCGQAHRDSPLPRDQLVSNVNESELNAMEQNRKLSFISNQEG